MGKYCSCGKCNSYYKYILLAILFCFICTVLFGIGYCNDSNLIYLARAFPEDTFNTQESLSHHIIIHNIYRNFGIVIISIILYKYQKKNLKNENKNKLETVKTEELNLHVEIELIHENNTMDLGQKSYIFLVLGIIIYNIQDILTILYFRFDLSQFNLWILELPLISFFNYKLLRIKVYKHHKFAMILSASVCVLTKVIAFFIHLFSDIFKERIYNKDKFLYSIGIFSYLIIITLRAYSITELKLFMEYRFVSPFKLLMFIGLIGIFINIIIMIIFTYNKCATVNNIDIHLCCVDKNGNRNESYLENFYIYYEILHNSIINDKSYEVIIEVCTYFIGIISHFCYIYFYFLVIKYLSCVHCIFYSLVYAFAVRNFSLIAGLINTLIKTREPFNIYIFFLTITSDVFSGLGICIYCELFELNFCKLNYNLRRNIIKRSEEDINIYRKSDEYILGEENNEEKEENDSNSVYL